MHPPRLPPFLPFVPFAFLLSCSSSSGGPGPAVGPDSGALTAQGCRPDSPATAYKAASPASVAATGTGSAPVPCLSLTGYGTSETTLGITSDGTVFMAPVYTAEGNGVGVSKDDGASWQPLIPKFPQGGGHGRVQPFFYLDPATGRMFFATNHSGGGFDLSWSDDAGATWNYELISTDTQDWIKSSAARPPPGGGPRPDTRTSSTRRPPARSRRRPGASRRRPITRPCTGRSTAGSPGRRRAAPA